MVAPLDIVRIEGVIPYAEMLKRQIECRDAVARGEAASTLFLLEHAPVITLGREADEAHLLKSKESLASLGIDVLETDRGGDVTYHGPGQLVAYPVVNLKTLGMSVTGYLRSLEEVLIGVLAQYGLRGERVEGLTGVWVDGAKIAAIGIGVRRWVTFHGIALNVAPNMDHFGLIVPCGIPNRPVTSLAACVEETPCVADVMDVFEGVSREVFFG
jgi:lipoyl(octanoyl) transferase